MYLEYWGLKRYPFENVADPAFFYETDSEAMIIQDMTHAAMRRKGAMMLTGDIGCGKTTLIQRVLLSLPEDHFDIAYITYPCLSPVEMLREINRQLGLPTSGDNKNALLRDLQARLAENAETGRDTLVCIDEAQSIPDTDTFEELRLLLNFQLADRFLMNMLLVGQPELQRKIRQLPQLRQRIALHLRLGPLSPKDTARYILHRLRVAGCNRPILTRQAAASIYQHTRGVPRRINHLTDHCLLLGMRRGAPVINSRLIADTLERYAC